MSRAKKNNEEIESESSSTEEVVTKKTATKKAPVKKTPAKPKAAPKKEAKKEPVKENSEDEFSDIEVEDDDTMANAEQESNDEVLVGVSKNVSQSTAPKQFQQRRVDPTIPNGELNVEQRINSLIDLAIDTYNLPLKNKMLEVKLEFTGKGKKPGKSQRRGGGNREPYQPHMQQQQPFKTQNYNTQNYRPMPETPNRDNYQMRGGMYNNRGGQRGGRGMGNRGGNNPHRSLQDADADIYADI